MVRKFYLSGKQSDQIALIDKMSTHYNILKGRLAQFRPMTDHGTYWTEKWKRVSLKKFLDRHRSGELGEYEPIFKKYLTKNAFLLEAGCGTAYLVAALQARGYQVEGIDNSAETVKAVKEAAPDLQVKVGDIYRIDCADETYDGYVSIGVVEHNENGPLEALKEACRVLKPSGAAFISIPHLNHKRKKIAKSAAFLPKSPGIAFHQYYFEQEEFENDLKKAGFEIVETFPYAVSAGLTRDFAFGRWLYQKKFFHWRLRSLFNHICGKMPKPLAFRWAHMVMYVCRRK